MRNLLRYLKEPIYKNSIYLIFNSGLLSLFGFFFWTISARLFTTSDVGIAATLISLITLLGNIALLGLNIAIIKFFQYSKNKKTELFYTSFAISSLVAIFVAFSFVLFNPIEELFFLKDILYATLFAVFVVLVVGQNIIDSTFIAEKKASKILIKDFIWSLLKVFLLFVFVSFGAFGILSAFGFAMLISLFIAFFFIYRINISFFPKFNFSSLKGMFSFSLHNYLANILYLLPATLLPAIITAISGAEQAAYFYIAWSIAMLIFLIPKFTSYNLLADGNIKNIKKGLAFSLFLSLIGIFVILLFGKYFLLLFGSEYAANGFMLLVILSISSIPHSLNHMFVTLFNIKKETKSVLLINLIITSITILLSTLFLYSNYSLLWIGISWILGNIFGNLVGFIKVKSL